MKPNWKQVSLGSVVTFLSGGTPRKSEAAYWDGEIPWVSSGEMTQRRIWDTELRVTDEGADNGTKKIPADTVLVVVRGMSLAKEFRVAITLREMTFNQDLKALRTGKELTDRFLFYYLLSQRHQIRDSATEASHGTKKLETRVLEEWPIRLPDISTQNAISEILSAYDDLIENNRRRMALLEESARLLYREWFVHLRFPGHEHVPVKDGVPEGWERRNVGDVLTLQRGFDLSVSNRNQGSVPIYASTGITGFHDKAIVPGPGVVTGRSGSLGTVKYTHTDFWPLNTALWVKDFKGNSPIYIYHLLSEMHLEQFNGGAAVPTLNRNDVHRIGIVDPPKLLKDEFAESASVISSQLSKLEQMNDLLVNARDLLLPRLMNGEIAV